VREHRGAPAEQQRADRGARVGAGLGDRHFAEDVLSVDRTFPLAEIAEAHRTSERGQVRGRLVLVLG
jgi:NADPH:quinone reductase-like Zn-dependent oxidoreductase